MTVSWLQPPRALRWRATDRAVVLASNTMLSPSWTSVAATAPIRVFSSAWSRSRISNASSGRLRSIAMAPPWVRRMRRSDSSAIRSLRIVTAETPNRVARSVTRARPCSSTIRTIRSCRSRAKTSLVDALAVAVTPLLGLGARGDSGRDGFVCFPRQVRPYQNAMSRRQLKPIEICGRLVGNRPGWRRVRTSAPPTPHSQAPPLGSDQSPARRVRSGRMRIGRQPPDGRRRQT